jgi:hypothetical protein
MPNGDDNLLIKNCFLCQPDRDLIVWENEYLVAMVGLGLNRPGFTGDP